MRNLQTLHVRKATLDQDTKKFFSCDSESRIYVISEDNILYVWNLLTNKEEQSIPLEGDELLDSGSEITGCQFIPDLEAVCVCTLQGDILLYENSEAEVVGSFDAGIVSMAWSPDYELVIFATQNGTLIEMTKDWEVVTEVPIDEKNALTEPNPNFQASLSWRGDGKVFACLASTKKEDHCAKLFVFDRACVHESTSEAGVKIEGNNLSWRPSGSVITCTQRLPHRYDTIFFERNGLRHGEFTFREDCTAHQLEWNSASDLLGVLVHIAPSDTQTTPRTALQIWYQNNWHWYLKQEFLFGDVGTPDEVLAFHWDEEEPLQLVSLCRGGEISQFLFHWDTNVSAGLDRNNQSTVAVIDGKDLLITPLRRLVPPPPMAATTLSTFNSVRQVFYAPKTYNMFVIHSDGALECYKTMELPPYRPGVKKPGIKGFIGEGEPPVFDQQPQSLGNLAPQNGLQLSSLYQWICIDAQHLLAIECDINDLSNESRFELLVLSYSLSAGSVEEIARVEIPGVPLRLYNNPDTSSVFLSLADAAVLRFDLPDKLTTYTTLPTACATIQSVCFGVKKEPVELETLDDLEDFEEEEEDKDNEEYLIALNNRSRLYINGEECSRECNSFAVHERYILFSTLTHKLRFIDHSLPFSRELLETTPQHTYDVCNREVERGSRIVAVVPYDTKVILQMPRGNLETIYPRALLLSHCRILLDKKDYRNAFLTMRHHRIDLNLLYDYNPSQFIQNVDLFIDALDSPTFLNLFLSSLTDADVTITLFPQREKTAKIVLPTYLMRDEIKQGKVNKVCTTIRSALETRASDYSLNRYLLSILTTLVKSSPPRFGEALEIIRTLQNKEVKSEGKTITAESALDYLVFLVDVNHLYDVALSLYDFELTIMVASKSQKDPKEYLPFLKELHELSPPAYQKYAIDMHLQNWDKALRHISQLEEEEHYKRAVDLIRDKKLYSLGIKMYSGNEKRSTEIKEMYAKYLYDNGEFYESGILYQRCGQLENALQAFKKTTEWQMVFSLVDQLGYEESRVLDVAENVANTYWNMGRFDDAAHILVEYAKDPTKAIECLTQGCLWTSAIRLCYRHKLENLISDLIEPAVQESQEIQLEMLKSRKESFQKQLDRVIVVKRSKLLMPQLDSLPSDPNLGDVFSETSSFASSRSSFSYVSMSEGGTKKRKRKKKKRISGKEGSLYEEEYLIDALKKLIPSEHDKQEVNSLLKILLILGRTEEAEELQNALEELIAIVEPALEILIAPITPMPGNEEQEEEDRIMREKIETKEKLDRLFKETPWKLQCVALPK